MHSSETETRLVWVDLEMTGLNPMEHGILEVAMIVTGADLVSLGEVELAIWQPPSVLENMSPFVRKMHEQNGLLQRVRQSQLTVADAERELMSMLTHHCGFRQGILAGNSIHQDRRFLRVYMPVLDGYLHYRMLDVSSLKVLAQMWYPGALDFQKKGSHTALEDIRESIDELRFYQRNMMLPR